MKTLRLAWLILGWLFVAANLVVAILPPYSLTNLTALLVAFVLAHSLTSTS